MYCRLLQQVPVVKKVQSMLAEDLIWANKVIFSKFGLPKRFGSDVATKFVSELIKESFQVYKYRLGCNLIVSLPEQRSGGDMYKVCDINSQEM